MQNEGKEMNELVDMYLEQFFDGAVNLENDNNTKEYVREFSCIVAPTPKELSNDIITWGKNHINDSEVYAVKGFGRELDPHVTIKFGLHETSPSKELMQILSNTQPFEIKVGNISLFENDDFDVLKLDITSNELVNLNSIISSKIKCTDTHPTYHPHLTISYIKKGTCRNLIGKPIESNMLNFLVTNVIFSSVNKDKIPISLGKQNKMT